MAPTDAKPVPIIILSGFLGAGKTTLLKEMLTNDKAIRFGLIVNDVASINVDAKVLRNADPLSMDADTIQLQDGCMCCSKSDELLESINGLLVMSARNGKPFHYIVIETSGIAEPRNIRDQFNDYADAGLPIMNDVVLDAMVTVVDAGSFTDFYRAKESAAQRPDLGFNEGESARAVVDLLIEQVECADVLVLNKADTVPPETMAYLREVVSAINSGASMHACEWGKVPLEQILSPEHATRWAGNGTLDSEHRAAAARAKKQKAHHDHGHGHKEEHGHGHESHGHKEEHGHGDHEHAAGESAEDCGVCKHDHGHDHGHAHDNHGHGHEHAHSHGPTTAETRFGITSFVYCARKPFHPQRLVKVVRGLPATRDLKATGVVDEGAEGDASSCLATVIRSKGYVWLANHHNMARYWSHAGRHFEVSEEGAWWHALGEDEWPESQAQRDFIMADFQGEFGDRRQEIIFIGQKMDEGAITKAMDDALLTDEEMRQFRAAGFVWAMPAAGAPVAAQ